MNHYYYLLANLLSVLFPFVLSFDKKVAFYKQWKYLWPGTLITGLFFIGWDQLFTTWQIWTFNPEYLLGIYVGVLPVEEILFFFTIPYACTFVYECLNYYIKKDLLQKAEPWFSYLFIVLNIFLIFNFTKQLHTSVTSLFIATLLFQLKLIYKSRWLGRFWLAYLVCLIPFLIVNGILTSLPVFNYHPNMNTGIRIFTIPIEDGFYNFLLMLMNIGFFEWLRRKTKVSPLPIETTRVNEQ